MTAPLLRARGITKRFGDIVAVSDVDCALHRNEIHAVIGPNGAGKSTLLSILAGELAPNVGTIMLDESDITRRSVEARTRRGIGRTFQRSAIIQGATALDMVRLAALRAEPRTQWLRPLDRLPAVTARSRTALARVGLAAREETQAEALSHGERRRLEIAAVLALSPRVLLLDEPLAGLGRDGATDIVALIEDLRASCAIMLIEHDIDVVFRVADRITVLHQGRVIAAGDPASVRANPAVQEAYLGQGIEH